MSVVVSAKPEKLQKRCHSCHTTIDGFKVDAQRMVTSGETIKCQTQYRISGCLYRGSSFSGRVTADGSCVGSKRALAKAVQRRNVLYESLLFDEQKIATQTRQSQLKRVSVEDIGGTSRRQMLQMGGTAALFSVATSAKAKVQFKRISVEH